MNLNCKVQVAAGTLFLFTHEEFVDALDVMFADEASQISLIDAPSLLQLAHNVVLLSDPQQLKQPKKGTYPDCTELTALEHIL
jgi:hypothetical protein